MDRFIPNRSASNLDMASYGVELENYSTTSPAKVGRREVVNNNATADWSQLETAPPKTILLLLYIYMYQCDGIIFQRNISNIHNHTLHAL